ncbi:MAG: branched-chain amino acid ABC transporter permease [Rhizobiales bacterium 65-9]|nr:branched-chain amino acid ABC transporter permease [Hyphomicrobiales bacterium]OJY35307.1 MAG: branched-chain amino acid ABC transporter permease [Rhizobiales bacterium 65-9]
MAIERVSAILFLLAAIAAPMLLSGFFIFQVTMLLVYAIAIMGLNLLTGFNGQFSLGHSAFYAIGAYAAAILMDKFGIGYLWTLPLAGLICFAVGFLFGFPALRLEGTYLALATFGLAVATPQILKLTPLEHWTGGVQGVFVAKPNAAMGLPLTADQWLYYLTLSVFILLYILARNLIGSRTGRALLAIRENPIAAQSMGINVSLYKTLTFGVSAAYTGVAGALGAIVIQFVAPDSFGFMLSVTFLVGLVVGGIAWLPGALIGAAFILFVPNFAEEISKGLSGAAYGVIMILLMYVMPSGAGGIVQSALRAVRAR